MNATGIQSKKRAPFTVLAAGLCAWTILVAPVQAESPNDEMMAEMHDRVAIEQLMWDYVRAADTLDADAYSAAFTPDGSFGEVKGSDNLRKMIVGMAASQAERRASGQLSGEMHHFMTNRTIEFIDRDHARVHYYWQTVFAGKTLDTPPKMVAAGHGVDHVARVNGRWLIVSRNVSPED